MLPGHLTLRGEAPAGPLLVSADGSRVVMPSGPDSKANGRHAQCYASFATQPFTASGTLAFESGWRLTAACLVGGTGAGPLAAAGYRDGEPVVSNGTLYTFAQPAEAYCAAPKAALAELTLPGKPAAIVPLPSGDRVAVLYLGPDTCAVGIAVVDLARGEIVDEVQNLANEARQMAAAPGGMAISRSGRVLFALVTGYAIGQRSGEAVSWLYALDPQDLARQAGPLELPGVAEAADAPIQPVAANSCWVATRPRGSDFAYATLATATMAAAALAAASENELIPEAQLPFSGVFDSFSLAPEPAGTGVAVAVDDCVQIRGKTGETRTSWSFQSSVTLLRWARDGLLAGEAGRLHLLDPVTPEVIASVQLQTGHVVDAAILPEDAVANDVPEQTDRLELPRSVLFRGEAAGQEVKALPVQPPRPTDSWQIDYDREEMPWLVIHPTTGVGPGVVYMGVDPAWYRPGSTEQGVLYARLTTPAQDLPAPRAEATVEVRLLPEERFDVRRVLWIWDDDDASSFRDESDPRGLRALAELLAGPPHFLAHREVAGAFQEPLDPYAVVVLDAAAAARGWVTRRAVLDYVRGGGALLFLGRHLPETSERELTQWLAPMGIQIDARALVEGVFPANSNHWLTRHWPQTEIREGCAIYTDYPEAVCVPGVPEGQLCACVFMSRTYGLGRLAALASKSPLESRVLKSQQARLFAADLFCWLAGAEKHLENQDMDSDGLPDDIEDANGNGITEKEETDFLKRDSDGDGLPDGMEDLNMNGLPDEGETDPLNADSDGDEIQDAADESPAPPAGAPVLHSLQPESGPAEGGTTVVVSGRNLPSDAVVWFGGRLSPSVRVVDATELVAETPAFPEADGGQAKVRVASRTGDVEGAFTRGFAYAPRSTVRLALTTLDRISRQNDVYAGRLAVRLEKPPNVPLENVTLVLAPDPPGSVLWPRELLPAPQPGRPVMRPLHSGEMLVAVLNAGKLPESAQLTIVPWRVEGQLPYIRIKHALVYAHNGQILESRTYDLALSAAVQAKRNPDNSPAAR